jgi:peptidoglycan/xylan/chitin deacetylase (PgdA/CDA1 family)
MQATLRKGLAAAGWRIPIPAKLSGQEPVTLMYHGISRKTDAWGMDAGVFEEHIRFLARHFDIVDCTESGQGTGSGRPRVALTFDDGFRNNADVVAPILRRYRAQATFFIATRHCEAGKYLWTSYLRALEDFYPWEVLRFRGESFSMRGDERPRSIRRLRSMLLAIEPHTKIYEAIEQDLPRLEDFMADEDIQDRFAGMSADQIRGLAEEPSFRIGGHTEDHLLLSRCDDSEIRAQLEVNKLRLETWIGKPCADVAYPRSDYDARAIAVARAVGFRRGYSAEQASRFDRTFERFRIGIYYPSLDELGCKVRWARLWIEKLRPAR